MIFPRSHVYLSDLVYLALHSHILYVYHYRNTRWFYLTSRVPFSLVFPATGHGQVSRKPGLNCMLAAVGDVTKLTRSHSEPRASADHAAATQLSFPSQRN